jgi:hypothetical protein
MMLAGFERMSCLASVGLFHSVVWLEVASAEVEPAPVEAGLNDAMTAA